MNQYIIRYRITIIYIRYCVTLLHVAQPLVAAAPRLTHLGVSALVREAVGGSWTSAGMIAGAAATSGRATSGIEVLGERSAQKTPCDKLDSCPKANFTPQALAETL